jgi:hypothetical protein
MPVTKPQPTVLGPRNEATVIPNRPFPVSGQVTNQFVSGEPVMINAVTVRVDSGPVIEANLTVVTDRAEPKVNFAASAQVTGGKDPHAVTVTATNDQWGSTTQTVSPSWPSYASTTPCTIVTSVASRVSPSTKRMRRRW